MRKLKINNLYVMDCFKFLELIPEEFADLIVIDPPYNMNKDKWDKFNSTEDFFKFTYSYLDMLIPKLKNTGSFYIFNSPFNCALILKYLLDKGLIFQNWITWNKKDGLSSAKRKYTNTQETILFFTKSNNYIFSVDDIRILYESVKRITYAQKMGIIKNGRRWFPNQKENYAQMFGIFQVKDIKIK